MRRESLVVLCVAVSLTAIGLGAQLSARKIDVQNVAFENNGRTLALEITNLSSEPITAYRVTAIPDCPEGTNKNKSTNSVQRLFSTIDAAKVGEWYSGSPPDTGAILPRSTRKVTIDVGKPSATAGPCKGTKLGAVTAVFADGGSVGEPEVAEEILDYRRGEGKEYGRWLRPFEDALASETPAAVLAGLLEKLDAEHAEFEIRDGDDLGEGERHANRSIRRTLDQLARMFNEKQDLVGDLAQRLLKLHQVRAEALARY
ncbi:MAG: hypothetical protein O2968_12885 [Acidobacteria bacterium]|nr:hypothetical protein [Acidobacteriota bacterium]